MSICSVSYVGHYLGIWSAVWAIFRHMHDINQNTRHVLNYNNIRPDMTAKSCAAVLQATHSARMLPQLKYHLEDKS